VRSLPGDQGWQFRPSAVSHAGRAAIIMEERMTLEDVQDAKRKAEQQIAATLHALQDSTGCDVALISLVTHELIGGRPHHAVELYLRIPR
jgi:hypothetical protein